MAFCPNCGTAASGQFCPNCGTNISTVAPGPSPLRVNAGGLTANLASALCYVFPLICGIVFLLIDPYKKDRNIRFDAFQSIFLAIALWVVGYILEVILIQVSWNLFSAVHGLFYLGSVLLWIYLAFKAFQNQKVALPVLGPLAQKQASGGI